MSSDRSPGFNRAYLVGGGVVVALIAGIIVYEQAHGAHRAAEGKPDATALSSVGKPADEPGIAQVQIKPPRS